MVSQSWDGKGSFTSSVLARWGQNGGRNEKFPALIPERQELKPAFDLDFTALKLGQPLQLLLANRAARTWRANNGISTGGRRRSFQIWDGTAPGSIFVSFACVDRCSSS